jgi:protocatechuate 4,5-dioxygenase beta chain
MPIVSVTAVPHEPTLGVTNSPELLNLPETQEVLGIFAAMRKRLHDARPDVILMVANDHINQFFMNNMPAFLIGKSSRVRGPLESEVADWGLLRYDAPLDRTLARLLLEQGSEEGVDFAYSDEFVMDHAFTIPLNFMRPEQDLPVVPLFLNVMCPPIPGGSRCFKVASVVRKIVNEQYAGKRVAVITTGHMSNSVGGPRMMMHAYPLATQWDERTWDLIQKQDVQALVKQSTWKQLYEIGNGTPGFMGYLFAFALAGNAPLSFSRMLVTAKRPTCAFLEWDEKTLREAYA